MATRRFSAKPVIAATGSFGADRELAEDAALGDVIDEDRAAAVGKLRVDRDAVARQRLADHLGTDRQHDVASDRLAGRNLDVTGQWRAGGRRSRTSQPRVHLISERRANGSLSLKG